jgi:hypothetical protein
MATATLDDITHDVSHDVTSASLTSLSTSLSVLLSGSASQKHASAIFRGLSSSASRSDRRSRARLSCSRAGSGMTGWPGRVASVSFLNNRYHDPTLGRFISVDSLVSVTGSAYGYGNNNPTTYSDPTGLCVDECGGEGDRVVRQKQRDAVDSSTNEWLAKCSNAWSQCKDGDAQGRFGDIQNRARRRAVSVIDGLLGAGSVSHNERHDVICFGSDSGSCQSWGLPAIYNAATFTFDQAVLNHDSGNLAVSLRAMGVLVGGNSAIKALSALAGKSQVDMHHLFPQQFRAQFQQMGIDIENYKIPIPSGYHQSLHGADSSAFEGRWNSAWSNWFASNEAATADMALEQMMTMAEEAGLWDLPPVTPPGMYDRNGK